jgi:hypothetical protein
VFTPFLLPLSNVLVSSDTTAARGGGSFGSSPAGDGGINLTEIYLGMHGHA